MHLGAQAGAYKTERGFTLYVVTIIEIYSVKPPEKHRTLMASTPFCIAIAFCVERRSPSLPGPPAPGTAVFAR
jgi:hypothetical protein